MFRATKWITTAAHDSWVLKDGKWTEIKAPESLKGKGVVRPGLKNDLAASLKLENLPKGAESVNMGH